jgi:pimeloyl-ACP methyl ester carboxylesterase
MQCARLTFLALCFATLVSSADAQPAKAERVTPFTPYEAPQHRVPVGAGRYINMVCMGEGSPTVILSAGADGWSADWLRVQPQIAKTTKVCGWDRAGHGFSSGSSEPQDILHTEADLERALAGAGLTGPLVMVAHSLGAFETLIFADRHPDRVAGMVMVDPSSPDSEEQLAQAAPALMAYDAQSTKPFFDGIGRCVAALKQGGQSPLPDCAKRGSRYPEPLRGNLLAAGSDPSYWEAFLSMFQSRKLDSKLAVNPKRNYGAMPLIVLEAGRFAFPTAPADAQRDVPAARAVIKAGHEALARLSTRGTLVAVPDSAHWIAGQKPDVVIAAINEVIDQARASDTPLHR